MLRNPPIVRRPSRPPTGAAWLSTLAPAKPFTTDCPFPCPLVEYHESPHKPTIIAGWMRKKDRAIELLHGFDLPSKEHDGPFPIENEHGITVPVPAGEFNLATEVNSLVDKWQNAPEILHNIIMKGIHLFNCFLYGCLETNVWDSNIKTHENIMFIFKDYIVKDIEERNPTYTEWKSILLSELDTYFEYLVRQKSLPISHKVNLLCGKHQMQVLRTSEKKVMGRMDVKDAATGCTRRVSPRNKLQRNPMNIGTFHGRIYPMQQYEKEQSKRLSTRRFFARKKSNYRLRRRRAANVPLNIHSHGGKVYIY